MRTALNREAGPAPERPVPFKFSCGSWEGALSRRPEPLNNGTPVPTSTLPGPMTVTNTRQQCYPGKESELSFLHNPLHTHKCMQCASFAQTETHSGGNWLWSCFCFAFLVPCQVQLDRPSSREPDTHIHAQDLQNRWLPRTPAPQPLTRTAAQLTLGHGMPLGCVILAPLSIEITRQPVRMPTTPAFWRRLLGSTQRATGMWKKPPL